MHFKELQLVQKTKKIFRKKENFLILALAGVLLFIIAIPTQRNTTEDTDNGTATEQSQYSTQSQYGTQSQNGTQSQYGDVMQNAQGQENAAQYTSAQSSGAQSVSAQYALEQEERLTRLLEKVDGVGAVEVMVTLQQSAEQIALLDGSSDSSRISEQDASGGVRESSEERIEEETVMVENAQGVLTPYVVKVIEPVINGVVVIAEGGGNDDVRKNITEMVQALFGIEAHKIKVVKMKSE